MTGFVRRSLEKSPGLAIGSWLYGAQTMRQRPTSADLLDGLLCVLGGIGLGSPVAVMFRSPCRAQRGVIGSPAKARQLVLNRRPSLHRYNCSYASGPELPGVGQLPIDAPEGRPGRTKLL